MANLLYSNFKLTDIEMIKTNVVATSEEQTNFTVTYVDNVFTNIYINGVLLNTDNYTLSTNNLLVLDDGIQINDRIDLIEIKNY